MPSRIMVTAPERRPSPLIDSVRLVGADSRSSSLDPPPDGLPLTSSAFPTDGLPPLTNGALSITRPELPRDVSWISVQIHSDPPSETSSPEPGTSPATDDSPRIASPEYVLSLPPPTIPEPEASRLRSKKEGAEPSHPLHSPVKGVLSNDKRNSSLPRTPSYVSTRWSRTPSPGFAPAPMPRKKIRHQWPDAMWCRDVPAQRTALERSQSYAHKINELAMYDCGLGDWVLAMKGASAPRARNLRPP
jgi:hypothetical protein